MRWKTLNLKAIVPLFLICMIAASCQNQGQNNEQSPYLDRPAGDSLLRDTISRDSATWGDTSRAVSGDQLKTTDSLQSPSFP